MTQQKISDLFPDNFQAIPIALFIKDNRIEHKRLPEFYGGCFVKVRITDSRFTDEVLFVALHSLY